jgi:hypothetical protein
MRDPRRPRSDLQSGEARFKIDLPALSKALGGKGWIVRSLEADQSGYGTAEVGVDVAVMWKYFTTSVYAHGDLPVLATREALQNSRDAIDDAADRGQIRKGSGVFATTWDAENHTLSWDDNGIGMDIPTIRTKFLNLGASGKRTDDVVGKAGGFGVAKAVILGTSSTFRFEMHTRDNLVRSEGDGSSVKITPAPWRQGTRITIYDVSPEFSFHPRSPDGAHVGVEERIVSMLGACDLKDQLTMTYNGVEVTPLFSRRGGSRVRVECDWGYGVSGSVKAYRRPPGDKRGGYYVRLDGLFQFASSNRRGNLKADVVIDLSTNIVPGEHGYPLTASRDHLQMSAQNCFNAIVDVVERESESVGRTQEDEVFDPEDDPHGATAEIGDLTKLATEDPEFLAALKEAAGGLKSYYSAQEAYKAVEDAPSSSAPPASPDEDERDVETRTRNPGGIEAAIAALTGEDANPVDQVRDLLSSADKAAGEAQWGSSASLGDGGILTGSVSEALTAIARALAAGATVSSISVREVAQAVDRAVDGMTCPTGGGIIEAVALTDAVDKLAASVEASPSEGGGYHYGAASNEANAQILKARNPFGRLAGLWISKKNYDKGRARYFKKNYGRWIPYLTVWDGTLRMIATEAGIKRRFSPGFVLDDAMGGMAAQTPSGKNVIYIHPDRLKLAVKAYKDKPFGIAGYLHNLACHELTHIDGRMGIYHGESFSSAREDLAFATAQLLPAIVVLVTNVLKLKIRPSPEQQEIKRLRKQLRTRATRAVKPPDLADQKLAAFGRTVLAAVSEEYDADYITSFIVRNQYELRRLLR